MSKHRIWSGTVFSLHNNFECYVILRTGARVLGVGLPEKSQWNIVALVKKTKNI